MSMQSHHKLDASRLLRRPEVERLTALSRSTIYVLMKDGQFPRPVQLTSRAVAWPAPAVADWLECVSAGREWTDKGEV